MVHAEGPMVSVNAFPHVTAIANESQTSPYSPVYSNVLWERVVQSAQVVIVSDDSNKPVSLRLPDNSSEWSGTLNPFYSQDYPYPGNLPYPASGAYLHLIQEDLSFSGVCCLNTQWDGTTCHVN
eukprot:TRINITY_DN12700_c0_g1_i2.p1 TRINITY_DN12700_c0_g1~~TRINITY_DN12700_c0_g1_i2.p1  ORF type:complete len:124 (-),score=6.71 TRINITY_DN12700_c0_g1_i2:65-436(-)